MTTATHQTPSHLREQGVALLDELIRTLAELGYVKISIDTRRDHAAAHNVRHSYSNGEWTIRHWYDGGTAGYVKWSTRATMPDVHQVIGDIFPTPL